MKKIAFFVEGPTEAYFIKRLLEEIVKAELLIIKTAEFSGGSKGSLRVLNVIASDPETDMQKYQINIYISGTDNRVNSDINENLSSLKREGFSMVVGLRDLRGDGRTIVELPEMKLLNGMFFRSAVIPVTSIIAVMEIETWFLAETSHYENIHPSLTKALITSNIDKFEANPFTENLEKVVKPAEMLDGIYQLAGCRYRKSKKGRERTIDALDMANVYIQLPSEYESLNDLINAIESFL